MSLPAGIATTSISGTPNLKKNTSPERIAYRGALFLCHSLPPVGPCVAPCRGLQGWVGKTPGPAPAQAVSGQRGAGFGKPQNYGFWGGMGKVEKQAGERRWGCYAPHLRVTTPGNAGRFKGFRAFKGSLHNGVKLLDQAEKWGQFTAKTRHISK